MQSQCFTYDNLKRLKTAFTSRDDCGTYSTTGAGEYDRSYVYDPLGNLVSWTDETTNTTTSYDYLSTRPHAVTGYDGGSYDYDANGNQISLVHAGSRAARDFYVHLVPGFEPSPTDPLHLVLLMKGIHHTLRGRPD